MIATFLDIYIKFNGMKMKLKTDFGRMIYLKIFE